MEVIPIQTRLEGTPVPKGVSVTQAGRTFIYIHIWDGEKCVTVKLPRATIQDESTWTAEIETY